MKQIKQWVAMLSAAVLLFHTGCGMPAGEGDTKAPENGTGTASAAKGRYMEHTIENITLSGGSAIYRLADGSFQVNDTKHLCNYNSKDDGTTWEQSSETEYYEVAGKEAIEIVGYCPMEDGSTYVVYIDWNEQPTENNPEGGANVINSYIQIFKDGTKKQGVIQSSKSIYLASAVTAQGRIFGLDLSGTVYEIALDTGEAKELFSSGNGSMNMLFACGNYLVVLDSETPYMYDLNQNQLTETDMVLSDFLSEHLNWMDENYSVSIAAGEEENIFYIACNQGLYRHIIGGSVMEQMIDGALTSMGDTSKRITGLQQKASGGFLMAYSDGTLCSYEYDPDVATVPQKEIKVYSLYENPTIRQAISAYQKDNPDIYFGYEIGMEGSDGMTESDAILNLNTAMMAGEGPDVLALDGLPMDSYMEKGLLLDLKKQVAKIKEQGAYFENLLTAYEKEGVLYGIPVRFMLPVLAGEAAVVSKVNSLEDLMEQMEQNPQEACAWLGSITEEDLLNLLYLTASADFVEEKGGLDEDKVTAFLTIAKEIYKLERSGITNEMQANYEAIRENYYAIGTDGIRQMYQRNIGLGSQVMSLLDHSQKVIAGYLSGDMYDTEQMVSVLKMVENGDFQAFPGIAGAGKVFVPSGVMGISSKSDYVEEAGQFLSLMLSDDVQKVVQSDGYPVNRTAFASLYQGQENPNISFAMSSNNGDPISLDVEAVGDSDYAQLLSMIESCTTPTLLDTTIKDTIIDQGGKILTDQVTLEDGVDAIMQKIALYTEE